MHKEREKSAANEKQKKFTAASGKASIDKSTDGGGEDARRGSNDGALRGDINGGDEKNRK